VPKPHRLLSARTAVALATVMEFVARLHSTASLIDQESLRSLQNRSAHNTAKAQRELGVTYRPIEDTLYDTVAWYAGHGFFEANQFQGQWPSATG
jgi:dihydroflavonol-4-reductase